MIINEIAQRLERLGCPPKKCEPMAFQFDHRARMDAARKRISYESALEYVIGLMTHGCAAQGLAKLGPVEKGARPKRRA